jgi:hypothetical protein
MKERPILFKAEMVRAILDGRKTQTRRLVKHVAMLGDSKGWCAAAQAQEPGWVHIVGDYRRFCPHGQPGDRLWVKETFRLSTTNDCACYEPCNCKVGTPIYRADFNCSDDEGPWKPSIFMPRWASRITLEIVNVRVERLNAITEEDAQAEGCEPEDGCYTSDFALHGYVPAYRTLWESINGIGSWAINPFVWVIEFKKL